MKVRFIFILLVLFSPAILAKCPNQPQLVADVELFSCQAIEIYASPSKSKNFNNALIQQSNTSIKGTLLIGLVSNSNLVWKTPKYETDKKPWKTGEIVTLFSESNVADTCPESLPETKSVIEADVCCDVIPGTGLCLVPINIHKVNVLK